MRTGLLTPPSVSTLSCPAYPLKDYLQLGLLFKPVSNSYKQVVN